MACCTLILGVLCFVQFYLIRNTYNLTRDKYYQDVREAIGSVTAPPLSDSIYNRSLVALRQTLQRYRHGSLQRQDLYRVFARANDSLNHASNKVLRERMAAHPLLQGVFYKYQFDEIILYTGNRADTVLTDTDAPFVFMGESFNRANMIQIGYGAQIASLYRGIATDSSSTFRVMHHQFIDISQWKRVVWVRMAGILVLATGLIVAVIVLFYSVFRTMLRQKKIADIKTDFANNVTHELKTPLSSLGIIIKSLSLPEARQNTTLFEELLQALARQHAKLQHTTDSVLESSMLPQVPVRPGAVSLPALIHQLVIDFNSTSHTIQVLADKTERLVRTDRDKLQTILYNLLDNAVKYSDAGSEIRLHAYAAGKDYVIEIHDQGKGIPSQEQPRIFGQFYRVPEGNRHTAKGLGLGLYLSTIAATQLGGSITVQSIVGKGSTFTLKFPLHEEV